MNGHEGHPILKSVKHCPSCGSAEIHFAEGKAVVCDSCGLTLFFNAAAAVAVLLVDKAGRILLLRRAKNPGKGKLGVPGGFVDAFESYETAVLREVREETGLDLKDGLRYLCSSFNRYEYAGVVYVSSDVYFTAEVESFDAAQALDESTALEFIDPSDFDLSEMAFESGRVALRKYMEINCRA